jgi:hypothetical protein
MVSRGTKGDTLKLSMETVICHVASVADRGTWERPPAAPHPAACGWPAALKQSACGQNRNIVVLFIISYIFHISIAGNIDDALVGMLLNMPFVAIALNLILMTLGARSPGADATPRRHRLPAETTRSGWAWLTWKAYLCRGVPNPACMNFIMTRCTW